MTNIKLTQYNAAPDIIMLGTAGSFGVERLIIEADSAWDGLTITATFHAPDGQSREVLVVDGVVEVPAMATACAGVGRITMRGCADGIQRIAVDVRYSVANTSSVGGDAPDPEPDAWAQFVAQVGADAGAAQYNARAAQTAADTAQICADTATTAAQTATDAADAATAAQLSAVAASASARADAATVATAAAAAAQDAKAATSAAEQTATAVQDARAARNAAERAASGAAQSEQAAGAAADIAQTAADMAAHPPIPRDGVWWTWDGTAYAPTDQPSKGVDGQLIDDAAITAEHPWSSAKIMDVCGISRTTAGGGIITDALPMPVQELTLYGNSWQDGTPRIDAPLPVHSIDRPTITVGSATVVLPYTLRGIGNVRDSLILRADGTGELVRRVAAVEDVDVSDSHLNRGATDYFMQYPAPDIVVMSGRIPVMSNRFVMQSGKNVGTVFGFAAVVRFYVPTTLETKAAVVQWFVDNPTTLYYVLAEPVITPIPTDTVRAILDGLTLQAGGTAVTCDQPAEIALTYYANARTVIQDLSARIAALEAKATEV